MKMTAMRDRLQRAEDLKESNEYRSFQRAEAVKHSQDVCRVVAMVTQEERDTAAQVVAAIREQAVFGEATSICGEFFEGDGWGIRAAGSMWQPEDAALIQTVLRGWFGRTPVAR